MSMHVGSPVIPAQAGIQKISEPYRLTSLRWIPACAGMTETE
jgi:hypothetical protein